MKTAIRTIILGFALMIFGGILLIVSALSHNPPYYLVILSYSLFIGFLVTLLGVFILPNDKLKLYLYHKKIK